jgi:ATP-binding cassette subfamily B protein
VSRFAQFRAFLALEPEELAQHPLQPAPRPLRQGVQFHAVSFTYPGTERPALDDINLVLRPGERVALVGENGAGKTTLVKLLLGLYQPTAGVITVDGVDLREIAPAAWRQEATAIFQDFARYPATALENIAYADIALLPVDESDGVPAAAVAAAEQSGAAEVIAALPQRYATLLGKEFEGGVELSSGQWQKLALARAYLRAAQIVVLDEPTAALDPRAEVEVYRQFAAAAAGRCAVFISHRLGSTRLAQRIVVLRGGRIIEEGAHLTLLEQGGEYARMFRLQASWYAARSEKQAP